MRSMLEVILGLNTSQFNKEINKVEGRVLKWASDLKSQVAAAFSIHAVIEWGRAVAEYVAQIKDISEQYGIATDDVQRFEAAASKVGLKVEDFGKALAKLRVARKAAVENEFGPEAKAFDRLGLSLQTLNNAAFKDADILKMVAAALKEGVVSSQEMAAMDELLGVKLSKVAAAMTELKDIKINIVSSEDLELLHQMEVSIEGIVRRLKQASAQTVAWYAKNPKALGSFNAPYAAYNVASSLAPKWTGTYLKGLLGDAYAMLNPLGDFYNFWRERPTQSLTHNESTPYGPELPPDYWKPGGSGPVAGPPLPQGYENRLFRRLALEKDLTEAQKMQVSLTQTLFKTELSLMDAAQKKSAIQEQFNSSLDYAFDLASEGHFKDAMDELGIAAGAVNEMAGIGSAKAYKAHMSQLQSIGAYGGTYIEGIRGEQEGKQIARQMLAELRKQTMEQQRTRAAVEKQNIL